MIDFRGFLKRADNMVFYNKKDIIKHIIRTGHKGKHMVAIFNAKVAFREIPVLTIKKRDNLKAWLLGIENDICIIEFEEFHKAQDFSYSLPMDTIDHALYKNGKLVFENTRDKEKDAKEGE